MYGYCEDLHDAFKPGDYLMVHSLLKRFEFYREIVDARKVLTKQIVKKSEEENEEILESEE